MVGELMNFLSLNYKMVYFVSSKKNLVLTTRSRLRGVIYGALLI